MWLSILTTLLLSTFFLRRMPNLDLSYGSCFYKNLITRLGIRNVLRALSLTICLGFFCGTEHESSVSKCLFDKQSYAIHPDLWYADIASYLVSGGIPKSWTKNDRNRFFYLMKFFVYDDPYLFKYYSDQFLMRYIPNHEVSSVFSFCHD